MTTKQTTRKIKNPPKAAIEKRVSKRLEMKNIKSFTYEMEDALRKDENFYKVSTVKIYVFFIEEGLGLHGIESFINKTFLREDKAKPLCCADKYELRIPKSIYFMSVNTKQSDLVLMIECLRLVLLLRTDFNEPNEARYMEDIRLEAWSLFDKVKKLID